MSTFGYVNIFSLNDRSRKKLNSFAKTSHVIETLFYPFK